jgi:hypothetical protein
MNNISIWGNSKMPVEKFFYTPVPVGLEFTLNYLLNLLQRLKEFTIMMFEHENVGEKKK